MFISNIKTREGNCHFPPHIYFHLVSHFTVLCYPFPQSIPSSFRSVLASNLVFFSLLNLLFIFQNLFILATVKFSFGESIRAPINL